VIITNKFGVPDVIFNAAKSDKYSRGNADISVTSLIDSPQISVLRDRHSNDLEADVSDRIWALLGTATHKLLDDANGSDTTEERLFYSIGGWTISGGIDIQRRVDNGIAISDYKVTSAMSVIKGKSSWEKQLNCYAYLVYKNKGLPVKKLEICAILRDWSRTTARRDRSYPQSPITVVPVQLWDVEEQEAYILGRVHLHQAARAGEDIGCTPEEQWAYGEKWAAVKEGGKRAVRLFDTEEEASNFAKEKGLTTVRRPSTFARCEGDWCQVNRWCKQWAGESTKTGV
jgi:hypothetical protein